MILHGRFFERSTESERSVSQIKHEIFVFENPFAKDELLETCVKHYKFLLLK